MINFFNVDCIEFMKSKPDKCYDLAIVDPPYGMVGNVFQMKSKNLMKNGAKSMRLDDNSSTIGFNLNKPPQKEYFDELFRVSKNQIVFGMQYFVNFLPAHQCVIVWDKVNGGSYFSDAEIAWTSFDTAVRLARIHNPSNNRIGKKIIMVNNLHSPIEAQMQKKKKEEGLLIILKFTNMKKDYRKIEFGAGDSIEIAMQDLARFKERSELVYAEFNGKELYSDIDDLDSAYKKITGKTKSEFDAERQKEHEEYEAHKEAHKNAIPELTKEWIQKGTAILSEKYHEKWAKCVPIRLGDLYEGMELGATLDIVKELNAGCELGIAKTIIEEQGHSGMSFGLVCSMVQSFCDRGTEFVNFVK